MNNPHDHAAPPTSPTLPPGQAEFGGNVYMLGADGKYMPLESVKPGDLLKDQVARDILARAEKLSAAIAKLRDDAIEEMVALQDTLASKYGTTIGGVGGNISVQSYDGTRKVEVQVNRRITYGPEIQAAKKLVDECLLNWGKDSPAELRAIVADAFNVDQEGRYSRTSLVRLKRINSEDERWQRAMQAITDAETPDGSKVYARFYKRRVATEKYQPVSLDAANA
jgi:hypothetical protein